MGQVEGLGVLWGGGGGGGREGGSTKIVIQGEGC